MMCYCFIWKKNVGGIKRRSISIIMRIHVYCFISRRMCDMEIIYTHRGFVEISLERMGERGFKTKVLSQNST